MANQGDSSFGQFLNPEAMLTPGLAGALTMMITNALAVNFSMPRAHTGLAISFICGLLVLVSDKRLWVKGVYYVLNSLVIFCVALGANGLGDAHLQASTFRLTTSAYAADTPASQALLAAYQAKVAEHDAVVAQIVLAHKSGASDADIAKLTEKRDAIAKERDALFAQISAAVLAPGKTVTDPGAKKTFFAPWKF